MISSLPIDRHPTTHQSLHDLLRETVLLLDCIGNLQQKEGEEDHAHLWIGHVLAPTHRPRRPPREQSLCTALTVHAASPPVSDAPPPLAAAQSLHQSPARARWRPEHDRGRARTAVAGRSARPCAQGEAGEANIRKRYFFSNKHPHEAQHINRGSDVAPPTCWRDRRHTCWPLLR